MNSVLVQNQAVFEESDGFIQSQLLIFGNGLLGTIGHEHRKQRKMLNPVFSASHLKDMTPILFEVAHKMRSALEMSLCDGLTEEIDMLSWLGRSALEIIGEAGLGYSFDPMTNELSAHPFTQILKDLLPTVQPMLSLRDLLPVVVKIGTPKLRRLVVDLIPWKDLHRVRDMVDYMHGLALKIYNDKKHSMEKDEETLYEQVGKGKDLISILMKENRKAESEHRLDENEVISMVSSIETFVFSAMDTTSSAMARTLHLLAKHQDVQEKLRQELKAVASEEQDSVSYENLVSLPYLDAVCRETLRLHPPVPFTVRVALQDTVIPLSKPIVGNNGTRIQEIPVTRGTHIFIPITNANTNPDLWLEDAKVWKPERWLLQLPEPLVSARVPGVYSHLMTFIAGSRACIGFTMAQLEMKAVLSVLIQKFKFAPSSRDSDIFWQMNTVVAPVVGKDPHPKLPLKITVI
ncbi:hypothetical protein GYMLUDRAFT_41833 [Collybiopsis luxurians FD-317 M1]|uniref:Cytochrome P450 n=1 Tax=Collybiopsis luxurians FD-317 M1 TaxID=944289 RepID=A0A0D0C2P7_9AGAR|nr:hypothetical protein GYMLUDRAFT_41833 [Collybiopsis luxurians FD-317 M1]